MPEFNVNLWAPWRSEYIRSLDAKGDEMGCFLCDYAGRPEADAEHHVVCRQGHALAVLNRYPYTNGHLLVAPQRHVGELDALQDAELQELNGLLRDGLKLLKMALQAQGYNVGMNLGRCAGAGLPDHLHWHIVPRWGGDTNFMSTVGAARVIPQSLEEVYQHLSEAARTLGLV